MKKYQFPKKFLWGSATSSYQVEGCIENNDWAKWAKKGKVPFAGKSADHYNQYSEDFDIVKKLGQNSYRFSIEWSRIEPEEGKFNFAEIVHYRNVLESLNSKGIKPIITLYHFTLPIWFVKKGGFCQKESPEIFARYCFYVLSHLYEYCNIWDTINEPMVLASNGYIKKTWPPFKRSPWKYYKVLQNLIKSHNLAYVELKKEFPKLSIGIVKHNICFVSDEKIWNKLSRKISNYFWNHYFLKRVYQKTDHIGLNYYFYSQIGRKKKFPQSDMGWDLNPEGIYHCLMDLKKYKKPIFVAEAGLADQEDKNRAWYIKTLIMWVHVALSAGVDVRGFMYWSLLDNFEWAHGYDSRFGLVHVDFETRKRTIRESAYIYQEICESGVLTIE